MSNDTPQYVLAHPAKVEASEPGVVKYEAYNVTWYDRGGKIVDEDFYVTKSYVEELFVAVDMVQLHKQIEQIVKDACENAFMRGADYGRETTTENFKRYYDLEKAHEIAGSASERLVGLLTQGSEIQ